jgi:hypothetical protein
MANYGNDPYENQFNQAGALNPTPVVGGVGSTPQTDQTNLNVAAAMEAGDNFDRGFQPNQTGNALRASRDVPDMIGNAVEARRQALLQGITGRSDPDAPAILPSPKRQQAMLQEFRSLSSIAHQNAIEKAHQTGVDFKQQRDTEAANDYVGLIHDLNGITDPIGSPTHAAAASQVFENHPIALQTTAGREAAMLHARVHDTAASLGSFYPTADAALTANPGATIEQDPRGRGFRVTKYNSVAASAETELRKNYGFSPADFAQPDEIHAGDRVNGQFVPKDNGGLIQLTKTNAKGTKTNAVFTRKQFDDFKDRLGMNSQQSASAPATNQPNVSQADYQKLQPGQSFWWNGKQLTKQ